MGNAILPPLLRDTLNPQWYQMNFCLSREQSWSLYHWLSLLEYRLLKDLTASSINHGCTNNQGCWGPFSPCHFYLFSHTFQLSHQMKGLWDITSQSEYSFPSTWKMSRVWCVQINLQVFGSSGYILFIGYLGTITSPLPGRLYYLFLLPSLM